VVEQSTHQPKVGGSSLAIGTGREVMSNRNVCKCDLEEQRKGETPLEKALWPVP
jgi:hypothetical protein